LKMSVPELTTLDVAIEPIPEPAPTLTVPFEMVNGPSNVFVPVSVSVPVPCLVTEPDAEAESEMMPENVLTALPASVNVLFVEPVVLSAIAPAPSIDATVSSKLARSNVADAETETAEEFEIRSAAPSVRVPAEIVVAPVYVFVDEPERVNVVPLPAFVSPPLPLTTPANVVEPAEPEVNVAEPNEMLTLVPSPDVAIDPTVSLLFARLNVVLFAIDTGDVSEITPAAPTVSVPAEIVVAPV